MTRPWVIAVMIGLLPNCLLGDEPPLHFSLLTYNVYLRAPSWLFRNDHAERSELIPAQLKGYDVVILQELFSNAHREQIMRALANTYPYRSQTLGTDELFSYNGGVMIVSRWPISEQKVLVFDECMGPDCMVKKGVIYVRLNVKGRPLHIFGLHMQAERGGGEVRRSQLRRLEGFIKAQAIPTSEPVLIAGDFNIDFYTNSVDGEFGDMLAILGARFFETNPEPSFDSVSNTLLAGPVRERLDYILSLQECAQPRSAKTAVTRLHHLDRDLSDHHGVAGYFEFGPP